MSKPLLRINGKYQFDVKCNALNSKRCKPAITVFADSREEAINLAIEELKKYGYVNVTVDYIVRIKP